MGRQVPFNGTRVLSFSSGTVYGPQRAVRYWAAFSADEVLR